MNGARHDPLSATAFAVLGAAILLGAVALALLGSFAYLAAASVGLFFVAAALIARAASSPGLRMVAVIALVGLALVIFGMVATPLFYLGWAVLGAGLIAAAALISMRRRRTR